MISPGPVNVPLTRQGVRDLDRLAPVRRARRPDPLPLNCAHTRMRRASCGHCPRPCLVRCPCGFVWMFGEDTYG